MQIVYKNSEGGQVVFGQQPPFLVTSKKGFGAVENIITKQQQYGLDGSILVNQQLDDRTLEIEGEFIASSAVDLQNKRKQLASLHNPKLSGTLTYFPDNGNVYQIDVVVEQAPVMDNSSNNLTQSYSIRFISLDSYWIDKNQADKLIMLSSLKKNLTFPLRITSSFTFAIHSENNIQVISNEGDVRVGMIITLNFLSGVTNPKVLNVTTGEYFRLEKAYSAGELLTINTLRGEKEITLTKSGGTEENDLEFWDENSIFLQLDKGNNFFQLQADSGAENMLGTVRISPKVIGV
ncbi:phage tail family protein [Lactococcus kimchii]|uniref:phage tail family protein n=1 Tax=Lactococcus sp. S-13 TaxID=2507158 RepID=UPI001023B343|nr:phage tail family protein [Lactococcus sp. S-13]RZI47972.1 phage tail family protein [Lactococcus sp. S-13]RZI48419.1 phage tail family protein [Lactococcus sp. S-13]RZI48777.1 phage tail family protein [Lactococcus sp. S-13]